MAQVGTEGPKPLPNCAHTLSRGSRPRTLQHRLLVPVPAEPPSLTPCPALFPAGAPPTRRTPHAGSLHLADLLLTSTLKRLSVPNLQAHQRHSRDHRPLATENIPPTEAGLLWAYSAGGPQALRAGATLSSALLGPPTGTLKATEEGGAACGQVTPPLMVSNFFFLRLRRTACGIFIPRPGIEPVPPAVEPWRLNHWTARKVS